MRPKKSRQKGINPAGADVPSKRVEPVNRSTTDPAHAARVEPHIRRHLAKLAGAEVGVGRKWRVGTTRRAIFPGECFYRAALYVYQPDLFSAEGLWLVHGENTMARNRHAWVELPDGVVFDAVLQRFYGRKGYYDGTVARPLYKYTPAAASIIPLHLPKSPDGGTLYGDWHEPLDLPWPDPTNPIEVDEERALAALTARGYFPPPRQLRWLK